MVYYKSKDFIKFGSKEKNGLMYNWIQKIWKKEAKSGEGF